MRGHLVFHTWHQRLRVAAHLAAVAVVVVCWYVAAPRWWSRIPRTAITRDGTMDTASAIYLSPGNDLMANLVTPSGTEVYTIRRSTGVVGLMPSDRFFVRVPGGAISKLPPPVYGVSLDGTEEKLDRFDARPRISARLVEFTSFSSQRVRITLPEAAW